VKTSPAGIALITRFEGCELEAYLDASTRKIPTIGYGHTGASVSQGLRITQERACELLAADLLSTEIAVTRAVTVPITQAQFDSLVSLTYNIGPKNFQSSTLLKKLNAGDTSGAAQEFERWIHAGAEILPGLVARRAAERALFESS
jgi:lysozyme